LARHWWQKAVVYQIYPRSFQDSNNDGIGDLQGIIRRLDYLKNLGVDVLWLNPIYASPNDDNGYDIRNYQEIMSDFGTMADFDELLKQAHGRGLKIMMDLVVNHTSDEHHWFVESRKSVDNPYRDYYIWQDPVAGHAPNDWQSAFSGPAWQLDRQSGQYYLHIFSKKQVDLNWRNTEVRQSIFKMMNWWVDKGIDGFRMDVINLIAKPQDFTSTATNAINAVANGEHVHEYLREMNDAVLSKADLMTVGETPDVTPLDGIKYAGFDRHELNMIFQFEHMGVDLDPKLGRFKTHPFKLSTLKAIMSKWQTQLANKAWNALYWNNHDQARVVSRFGDDRPAYRVLSAKMLGLVLHYQQGTPYIYQGEEIGMTNAYNFKTISDYQDIEAVNGYQDLVTDKHVLTPAQAIAALQAQSRDNARTPMQWDTSANAGFTATGVTPWLGLNANYPTINVAQAIADKQSIFYCYQRMNQLRRQYPIIIEGDYQLLEPADEQVWAYQRHLAGQTLLVVANFTAHTLTRSFAGGETGAKLLQSNYEDDAKNTLRPYEAKVYLV
jgi:oligo-1,6-glucosidase